MIMLALSFYLSTYTFPWICHENLVVQPWVPAVPSPIPFYIPFWRKDHCISDLLSVANFSHWPTSATCNDEDELTRSLPRWHLCRGRPSPPSAAGLPPSLHSASWKCPAANGTWCASAGRSWSRAEAAAVPNKNGSGGRGDARCCLLLPMKSNHGWDKLGHIDTVEGAPRSSGRGERPSPCCSRLATDARRRHAHLTAHGRRLTGSWKDAGRTDLLVAYLLPG